MEIKSNDIPKDWSLKELGSLCEIYGRIGFRGYTVNDIVDEGQGAITVSPSNINNGKTNFSKCTYLSWRKYEESPEIQVQIGDILLVKTGSTVGKVAAVFHLPQKATVNPQIVVLKKSKVPYGYLGYQMNFSFIQDQLTSSVVGGALPTLSQKQIAQFKVPVPPSKKEQEAIANALFDADAYIESLEKLIAKKRLIKKGVMQELLTGRRRLEGFAEDWYDFSLADCLECKPDYGINAAGSPPLPSLPTYLRITDIDDEGYLISEGMIAVDHPMSKNYLLDKDQIVFARTGASVGKTYLYNEEHGELVFAGFLIRAKIKCKTLNPKYFFFLTQSKHYDNWVKVMSMRSGQPGINGNEYASFQFKAPGDIKEQDAIAKVLGDLSEDILSIKEKLKKACLIKQGMMQELLTGRIRLV